MTSKGGRRRAARAAVAVAVVGAALAAVGTAGGFSQAVTAAKHVTKVVVRARYAHARTIKHHSPADDQYNRKVTICHHTHSKTNPYVTITIDDNALRTHLDRHGDTIGPCTKEKDRGHGRDR